jgi:hypothetical protein
MTTESDQPPEEEAQEESEELPQPAVMLEKEQKAGYVLALLIVALAGAIGGSKLIQGNNGKTNYVIFTVLGLVGAAAIAFTARRGRRLLAAFTSVLAGLALSSVFPILGYACLIYGGYLMFRHSQAQKKLNQLKPRQPRAPRPTKTRRSSREPAKDVTLPSGNRRPGANRRYTPPKAKTRRH